MAERLCSLPGCCKPVSDPKHLTCSEVHHFLLMAYRFSSLNPHIPALSPLLCAFPPCSRPPFPGNDCCSRTHYLDWIRTLHQHLSRNQICKLAGCFRHAFVDLRDDGSPRAHEFCGWTHCQQFHIQSVHSVGETNGQHEHSVASLIESLKAYVRNKNRPPRNVKVDEDFFDKHPWEVLYGPEIKSCWLIARCKFKETDKSKRELITKEGFHWKQSSSKAHWDSEVSRKYFTYTKLRGRKLGGSEFQENGYTMIEYTIQNVGNDEEKNYCVVKVCREQSPSASKQSEKRSRQNFEGDAEVSAQSNQDATPDNLVSAVTDQWVRTGVTEVDWSVATREWPVDDLLGDFPDCPLSDLPSSPDVSEMFPLF